MISLDALQTGTEAYRQGERLFRRGSISLSSRREDALCYDVGASPAQTVCLLKTGEATCTCGRPSGPCGHVIAALLMSESDGQLRRFRQQSELEPVSYTHLDVYKRQPLYLDNCI